MHMAPLPLTPRRAAGFSCGFSMIEVLVTMLIISLALLGTAGLQAYSMRLNQSGQFRTQAVFLVADLAERMEANKAGAVAGNYVLANSSAANASSTACLDAACVPAALANFDLSQWQNAVASTLPQSSWTVTQIVSGNPSTYDIVVSWVDRRQEETADASGKKGIQYSNFSASDGTGINATGTGERFFYRATRTIFN